MTSTNRLIAIYDFEFFPYALGDVLTWNVRTAMRCEELGKEYADIYICVDEKFPASIYQRGLVNPDNFDLFFSELYGAFGTNPKLGNFHIFRSRESMLAELEKVAFADKANAEAYRDYLYMLKHREPSKVLNSVLGPISNSAKNYGLLKKVFNKFFPQKLKDLVRSSIAHEYTLNNYFIKYVYSHEKINEFAEKHGHIPLLKASLGCGPDVDEIIARQFAGKKIVPFHLRLRRLDVGYGGDHSYARDSDFLEWYDFLKAASVKYPEVQFVALGRLQEKPLEILRLPNVASLRIHGMGLGHELTLMLKSDLFIGSSSGFAALANFSALPYFITKMNPGSCHAYAIPEGAEELPFALKNQKLVYDEETSDMLMDLLQKGLGLTEKSNTQVNSTASSPEINVAEWLKLHLNPSHTARTTSRFYNDEPYRQNETAYLLLPYLDKARKALVDGDLAKASTILNNLKQHFPQLCENFPQYWLMKGCVELYEENLQSLQVSVNKLEGTTFDSNYQPLLQLLQSALTHTNDLAKSDKLKSHMEELTFAGAA